MTTNIRSLLWHTHTAWVPVETVKWWTKLSKPLQVSSYLSAPEFLIHYQKK